MKLYKYSMGITELYGAADDAEDAYNKRVQIDPTFIYTPVTIEEVTLQGYEIVVTPIEDKPKSRKKDSSNA